MRNTIDEFRGSQLGRDVWVIGGGASLDYLPAELFAGRVTVGINGAHRKCRTSYLIRKDARLPVDEPSMRGIPLIMSEFDCSNYSKPRNDVPGAHYFEHVDNSYGHSLDLSVIGDKSGRLVVAYSTLASALHFACELGAKSIVCCGCDGGALDGRFYFEGHDVEPSAKAYNQFLWEHLSQIRQVRDALQDHYGIPIVSLSPFVGLTTDGHEFTAGDAPPRCKHCGRKDTIYRCRRPGDARFYECPACGCMSSTLTYADVGHVYQTAQYRDHLSADYVTLMTQVSTNVGMLETAGVPEKTVLDVGCFDGSFLYCLRKRGWDVWGWDVAPFARQVIEKNTDIPRERITIGTEFTPPGRQFGAVISRETLEHVPNHRQHLSALVASVMPGGVLHLQTPRPHADYEFGPTYNHGHLILLTPECVEQLLTEFGLNIEQKLLWETGQAWIARKPA